MIRRLAFWIGYRFVIDPVIAPQTNAFRAELGLPPVRHILDRWIHSPQCVICFFPDWFGPPQVDWPPNVILTGFPLFDERGLADLPRDVDAFLSTGAPPIVFTPGSAMKQGQAFFAVAVEACVKLGRRGMLLTPLPRTGAVAVARWHPALRICPVQPGVSAGGGGGASRRHRHDRASPGRRRAATHHAYGSRSARQCRSHLAPGRRQADFDESLPRSAVAKALGELLHSPEVAKRLPIRCRPVRWRRSPRRGVPRH